MTFCNFVVMCSPSSIVLDSSFIMLDPPSVVFDASSIMCNPSSVMFYPPLIMLGNRVHSLLEAPKMKILEDFVRIC